MLNNDASDELEYAAAVWYQMQEMAIQNLNQMQELPGGSRPGRRPNVPRDFRAAHKRLMLDYFWPANEVGPDGSNRVAPLYYLEQCERRFHRSRVLFGRNFSSVVIHNAFLQRGLCPDFTVKVRASPLQKVVSSLRYWAYGSLADSLDGYVKLGEATTLESMKQFCWLTIKQLGPKYLRPPSVTELSTIASGFENLGFPRCIECLDCAGWDWEQFLKAIVWILIYR